MTINGKVIDDQTGQPIPRATISLLSGNVNLKSISADDSGNFSITTTQNPDSLLITSVGYQGTYWPLPKYESTSIFDLPVSTDPLDTIVVEYKPKSVFPWWLIVIAAGILLSSKNKKVYAYTRRRTL